MQLDSRAVLLCRGPALAVQSASELTRRAIALTWLARRWRLGPYTRETIENWVSDYCSSDRVQQFPGSLREFAHLILAIFLADACAARNIEPAELEESDAKAGLLGQLARLQLPES